MQVTVFVICILSRRLSFNPGVECTCTTRIGPHRTVYRTLHPPTHNQCVHRLVDKLVFADKWITSEATHMLVTLTNGVRVWQGKRRGRS